MRNINSEEVNRRYVGAQKAVAALQAYSAFQVSAPW